jgi:hypothetical protein
LEVRVSAFPVRLLLTLGCCALAVGETRAQTTFVLPDTTPLGAQERALLRFEQERSAAIARHDTTVLRRMYADEFRGVTALGFAVNRDQLLGVFTRDDPTTVFTIDELAVRTIGGESAVLTGRLTTKRRASDEVVAVSRFIHVYVWRGGRWQILAGQGTLVPRG